MRFADWKTGKCYPKSVTVMRCAGISSRSVYKTAMRAIEKAGLIAKIKQGGGCSRPSVYQVHTGRGAGPFTELDQVITGPAAGPFIAVKGPDSRLKGSGSAHETVRRHGHAKNIREHNSTPPPTPTGNIEQEHGPEADEQGRVVVAELGRVGIGAKDLADLPWVTVAAIGLVVRSCERDAEAQARSGKGTPSPLGRAVSILRDEALTASVVEREQARETAEAERQARRQAAAANQKQDERAAVEAEREAILRDLAALTPAQVEEGRRQVLNGMTGSRRRLYEDQPSDWGSWPSMIVQAVRAEAAGQAGQVGPDESGEDEGPTEPMRRLA